MAQLAGTRGIVNQAARWAIAFVIPLAVLIFVLRSEGFDPELEAPLAHFIVISLISLIGAILATMVGIVAQRTEDSRVLLLSLAFFTVSGFFLVHGILTPEVVVQTASSGEGWSTLLALLGGAAFLAFSSLRFSGAVHARILTFRRSAYVFLSVAMLLALVVALRYPHFILSADVEPAAYGQPILGVLWGLSLVTVILLGIAMWRYVQEFRLARLRIQASVGHGLLFLMNAQVGLAFSRVWHVSWWIYHWLVLLAFATVLLAVVTELGQGATLPQSVMALFMRDTVEKIERGYNETIVALINSVEARDIYTKGHSLRVSQMAARTGEQMGLSPESLRTLHQAALLHDVGKIGIPDAILNKPGRLTDEEFAIIKAHPGKGEAMISAIPSLRGTLAGIRSHHERQDGSGYPDRLQGATIPLQARIIAVADVFDAMTSSRAYRPAYPPERALQELREGAGVRYDPQVTEAFLEAEAWKEGGRP